MSGLRPSTIAALSRIQDDLRTLATLLPQAQTPEERAALFDAIKAKARAIIILIDQVLDAPH